MGVLLKTLTISLRFFSQNRKSTIMKYLNVAEKNDAAKNIALHLSKGALTKREGYSNYNKIYEFESTISGQPIHMVMTSVSGHLLNYEFVSTFRGWQSCSPLALFDAPIVKSCPQDYQNIKRTLEREIRSCQGLIIWTDCDREGENIGFEIIKVCTEVKANIAVYRAKFSEITRASVFRAINNLSQPNKNVSDAVDVRQELDLRTGAAFTRFQTLRLQKVFPEKLADKLISYGSCQFPTLGFVVERYQTIENFIPEPFWKIKMSHAIKSLTVDFTWKRERLFNKNACEAILDVCQERPTATVELVESKPKSKWRPLPLDTVELEKTVSRKLRINAKDTMKIAEKLYTQGFISYPRTETNIFPKELDLVPLVTQQCTDNQWGPFAQRILEEGGPNPRQGRKSDQAHPPIHPIKYTNTLTGNDKRIYEYIVRHFLACVSKDAVGHETVVHVDIADEKFLAKGLVILERNYLDVYIYDKWNAKEIHEYQNGETFIPTELNIAEGTTSPPKLLTEADLIALMEKYGIGTDATHADHIDTIKSREYVGLHENIYFVPGTLGMGLVEGYNNIGLEVSLAKPTLRADFESDLKLICEGRKDAETVKREQIEKYKNVFKTVTEKIIEIDRTLSHRLEDQPRQVDSEVVVNQQEFKPVLKCPKCGNDMVVRSHKNKSGKYLSCIGFPECKNAIWLPTCIDSIEVLDDNCRTCGPSVKKLRIKFKHNPFPGEPNPNVMCIGGCDNVVLETLDIKSANVRRSDVPQTNNLTNQQTYNNRLNAVVNGNSRNGQPMLVNNTNLINRPESGNRNQHSRTHNGSQQIGITNQPNPAQSNHQRTTNANGGQLTFMPQRNFNISNNSANISSNGWNNVFNNSGSAGDAVCNCGSEAILLTVKKDGPNKGRKFYKCQVGNTNGGCDYFMWAPSDSTGASANASTSRLSTGEMKCNCNLPVAQRRVSKAGPNTGREFYCCPKPPGEGCGFFKWSDEANDGGANSNDDDDDHGWGGGSQNRDFGNTSRWRGGSSGGWKKRNVKKGKTKTVPIKKSQTNNRNRTTATRRCGICGTEGHTRTRCPNK